MGRLIDANELLKGLYDDTPKDVALYIANFPEAQAEIIKCKDCKYGSPTKVYGCRLERFSYLDEDVRMYGNDFCSMAERRTDGNN